MFCSSCGAQLQVNGAFCASCGARSGAVPPPAAQSMPAPPVFVTAPVPQSAGNSFSTVGIIIGMIAFLFLPIAFGPAGLILGAIGKSKGESMAVVAMVVSGLGLVVGMFLGYVMFSSF